MNLSSRPFTFGRKTPRAHTSLLSSIEGAEDVFAEYERRNRFIGPIMRAVISRLVGWRYDGTAAARRRVVDQLLLFGFRPPD